MRENYGTSRAIARATGGTRVGDGGHSRHPATRLSWPGHTPRPNTDRGREDQDGAGAEVRRPRTPQRAHRKWGGPESLQVCGSTLPGPRLITARPGALPCVPTPVVILEHNTKRKGHRAQVAHSDSPHRAPSAAAGGASSSHSTLRCSATMEASANLACAPASPRARLLRRCSLLRLGFHSAARCSSLLGSYSGARCLACAPASAQSNIGNLELYYL